MREQEVKKLYNAITNIDEKYIDVAENTKMSPKKVRRPLLIAACFIGLLALCGFGYAVSIYWGVGSAENISFDNLTQPFGTIIIDNDTIREIEDNAWEKSDIITDYTNVFADNSMCYSLTNGDIPSLYFSPAHMIIFAQESEAGWTLKSGESIAFNLSLNEKQNIELEFGYVLNGEYHELSTVMGHEFSETLQAAEDGDYYLCVTNKSSENAVIVSGTISKATTDN